jgi:hypothetical protein
MAVASGGVSAHDLTPLVGRGASGVRREASGVGCKQSGPRIRRQEAGGDRKASKRSQIARCVNH